jgi:hypothetical protein
MTKKGSSEQDTEVVAEKVVETSKEANAEVETAEAGKVSATVEIGYADVEVTEQPAPAEEQRAVAEPTPTETPPTGVYFGTMARNLYQMGLDLGLAPDEAALLTAETRLPVFVSEKGQEEFKRGLINAYQEMLDGRLQSLKQQLGVD